MKKINLNELAKEIRANKFTRSSKWIFESIEQSQPTKNTAYGRLTKYEVVIRYKVSSKYDDNGTRFEVNHYEDDDVYAVYFLKTEYLG